MILGLCGLAGAGKDTIADFLVARHGFVKVALADPLKRVCQDVFDFTGEQLWGPSDERNKQDPRYLRGRWREHKVIVQKGHWVCFQCGRRSPQAPSSIERPEWLRGEACVAFLSPRYALQRLGTEWGRDCYQDVWIDYALRVARKLESGDCYYDAGSGLRYMSCTQEPRWREPWTKAKTDVVIPDVRFRNEVAAITNSGGFVFRVSRPNAGLDGEAGAHVSETEQTGLSDNCFDAVISNDGSVDDLFVRTVRALTPLRET